MHSTWSSLTSSAPKHTTTRTSMAMFLYLRTRASCTVSKFALAGPPMAKLLSRWCARRGRRWLKPSTLNSMPETMHRVCGWVGLFVGCGARRKHGNACSIRKWRRAVAGTSCFGCESESNAQHRVWHSNSAVPSDARETREAL